jgi:hypothetical protein
MDAALVAEACGLCAILRGPTGDTIYIHPAALEQLCTRLQTRGGGIVPIVRRLAEKLQQLPAAPGTAGSGKLYEEVVTLAFVCRIGTCFNEQSVGDVLGCATDGSGVFDQLVERSVLEERTAIACFPRAAEKRADESWRNVACSTMPGPEAAPWFSIPTDSHNLVLDSLITLPRRGDGKRVSLAIQCREHAATSTSELLTPAARNKRRKHFEWLPDANVEAFLLKHDVVFVAVTPNALRDVAGKRQSPATWTAHGQTCYEAACTHADIRGWSPTVAYSGCDARVLQATRVPGAGVASPRPPSLRPR